VVLGSYALLELFFVHWLVHIACAGMAMEMNHGPQDIVWIYSDARAWSFLGRALLASGFVLLDLICLRQLISCWNRGSRSRSVAVAALGISLVLTGIHPIWLAVRGLKSVSPCFAEVFQIAPINRWLFGLLLAILFVTAAARRMILAVRIPACDTRWNWRRRPSTYFHEHRLVALLVAATILCPIVRQLPSNQVWLVFAYHLITPPYPLWLAVLCLALYRAIFGVARPSEGLCAAPPELPLSLFAIVWTALLAIVVMAVPIFAALGFGLCLNWWRLPF